MNPSKTKSYPSGEPNFSDTTVSIIRTMVPFLWGLVVSVLVKHIPDVELIANDLEVLGQVITLAVVGLWYSITRILEPKLPQWLKVVFFGVSAAPEYHKHNKGD